jgi:hypothetical protein
LERTVGRDQSAENEAAGRGGVGGPVEEDIPNVARVLREHRAGERQPAVHPGLLHADDKVFNFHSCNHRLVSCCFFFLSFFEVVSACVTTPPIN